MKLHLPKRLLTALLATFSVVTSYFTTTASGDTVDMLESAQNWTMNAGRGTDGSNYPTYNDTNRSITTAGGWGQSFATHAGALLDVDENGTLEFNITLSTGGSNSASGLALVGSTQTIVLGSPLYNVGGKVGFVITKNTESDVFLCGDGDWDSGVTSSQMNTSEFKQFTGENLGGLVYTPGQSYTITGTVTRTDSGNYTLDLKYGDQTVVAGLDLGYTMDINRVVLYSDGAATTLSQARFSGVTEYNAKNITWSGTSENHIWTNEGNNINWISETGDPAAFHQTDTVTFDVLTAGVSDAVSINRDVAASSIVVNDNYYFNIEDGIVMRGDLQVTSGKTLTLTGGETRLGNLTAFNCSGNIVVKEGILQLQGDVNEQSGRSTPYFVSLLNQVATGENACIKISGDVKFNYESTEPEQCVVSIDDNIHITGKLEINSWGSVSDEDGDSLRRWNVNEGGNLSVGGHLWLTNKQKMVVDGGFVSAAGGVKLGHESNGKGSWTDHSIYSKLIIEDGGVTTSGLTFHGGNNELLMSGGELTFTPTATEENPAPNVLSGGGTETYKNKFTVTGGTLKATDTSWSLEGTSTHVVSLGNATFDIAANKTVTLSGDIALTGALKVTGDGDLKLGTTTFNTTRDVLKGLPGVFGEVDSTQNGLASMSYQVINGASSQVTDTSVSVNVSGSEYSYTWNNGSIVEDGSVFVINTNFSTADASAENGATMADTFVVNKTGVFTIAGDITDGKTAKALVTDTLGSGTISLQTDVTLSNGGSVKFGGDLVIAEGAALTLGRGNGVDGGTHEQEYEANFSSLNALNLNGGTLNLYYVAPHIKSMTVETASTIYIDDVWSNKQTAKADATLIDSLQLDADLTMHTNWKSNVNIGVLSGAGNLTAKQTESKEDKMSNLWIDAVNNYTGEISLSGKTNLTLNSGETETTQAVRLSVDAYTGNISLGGNLAASLNIGDKQSLNASQLSVGSGSTATLTGSGLFDLGSATTVNVLGLTNADNWTGTVKISGNESVTDLNFANYGNEKSWVQLIGLKGYWVGRDMTAVNISTNIILGNETGESEDAFTHNNGYSSTVYTISGDVKGTGNLKTTRDQGDATVRTVFTGDVSGWTGSYINANGTSELQFAGNAQDINAAITKTGGKINLTVNRSATTTFNNTVEVDTLTTTGGGAVHFNKDVTVEGTVTAGGTLHVEDGTFVAQGTLNAAGKVVELSGSFSNDTGTVGKSTAKLRLEGAGNQVGTFEFGKSGHARGTLELGAESDTTAGALYMNKDVTISMEKGAQLTVGTSTAATDTAAATSALTSMTAVSDNAGISIDNVADKTRGQFTHKAEVAYVLTDMDVSVNYSSDLESNVSS